MKRILLAAAIGVAPWIAQATPIADCVERFASDRDCALEIAEAYSARYWPDQRPVVRASRALAEAGRIDAATRLLQLLKDEQDQYAIDFAILEFFAKERRFDDAQAYLAALPNDSPRWGPPIRTRASIGQRDFDWLWVSNAPKEDVLKTIDWIATSISSPEDRGKLRASLILTLAEQGHLDTAFQELQEVKPRERRVREKSVRVRRGDRLSTATMRSTSSPSISSPVDRRISPSRISIAANLVWISILKGRSDLARQINADFGDEYGWIFTLDNTLRPFEYLERASVLPDTAAADVLKFANTVGDGRITDEAEALASRIHLKRGEFAEALRFDLADASEQATNVRKAIEGLEAAGRYQEAIELADGAIAPRRLLELALKHRDFALVQRVIDEEDDELTRDQFRGVAFTALIGEDATEPSDLEHAYKFAVAMEGTEEVDLLTAHAATLPVEDRKSFFDQAGVKPSTRVRNMPFIAIYAAANEGNWLQVERLVDGLSQFQRPHLDRHSLADKALAAGEVEIAIGLQRSRGFFITKPYDDALLTLALNGEGARALSLIPNRVIGRKAMLSYAIWALQ
jgi:hypothetical protein